MAYRSETGAAMPAAWGAVLRLILKPHIERSGVHLDRFDGYLGDELIVTSRQPLHDGARELLKRGFAPDERMTIRHEGRDYDSFEPRPLDELSADVGTVRCLALQSRRVASERGGVGWYLGPQTPLSLVLAAT
jgi:hypothetical protein